MAPWEGFWGCIYSMVLSPVTLNACLGAVPVRPARANLIEVLGQPLTGAARARGRSPHRILRIHGPRDLLLALVTIVGRQPGALLRSAVLTGTVLSRPGVGRMTTDTVLDRKYRIVRAGRRMIGCPFITVSLPVDLSTPFPHPRLKPR